MAMVTGYTFDTTYAPVIADGRGGWDYVSQAEYDNDAQAREMAKGMYGGLRPDEYAVVKITREILPNQ